jgi:hypothetical protein
MLGSSLLKLRGPTYWRFHFRESRAIGFDLRVGSVFAAALRRVAAECQRPQAAIDKAYQYFRARLLPPA